MPEVMKTVGRYEILREVGRGGMAMVYLARQTDLDRFVALKELGAFHASDPSFAHRFLRESRVAGSLSHPNIVTVHDYFEHDGTPYIAMEYVERGSLRPYVGRMNLAQIGGVLEGLLAGLTHAESQGIVHRDLKPENLMVTADGRVKIADFGIAKATTKMQTGAFLTATGTTVGTPTYMAPEQAMAQDIGPWTDLYSVGCMAFELFTGNVPFHDSDAPMAILLRHVNEPIAAVKSLRPEVDPRISDWIEALLVKEPGSRTQNANDAWDDFEEILLNLLGPRWRREARLVEKAAEQSDGAKPLTPAPFPGTTGGDVASEEFKSFAWGAPASDTGPSAAPPMYTPPPSESTPSIPEPIVGPPTPMPSQAVPAPPAPDPEPVAETGFVTFGQPAPAPPTDALIPPAPAEVAPEASATPAEAPAPDAGAHGLRHRRVRRAARRPHAAGGRAGRAAAGLRDLRRAGALAAADGRAAVDRPARRGRPARARADAGARAGARPPEPVAATQMPQRVTPEPAPTPPRPPRPPREERASGSSNRKFIIPAAIVGGIVVVGVVGAIALGGGGGDEPPAPTPQPTAEAETGGSIPVSAAGISLKVPTGWSDAGEPLEVPGLDSGAVAARRPEGRLDRVRHGRQDRRELDAAARRAARRRTARQADRRPLRRRPGRALRQPQDRRQDRFGVRRPDHRGRRDAGLRRRRRGVRDDRLVAADHRGQAVPASARARTTPRASSVRSAGSSRARSPRPPISSGRASARRRSARPAGSRRPTPALRSRLRSSMSARPTRSSTRSSSRRCAPPAAPTRRPRARAAPRTARATSAKARRPSASATRWARRSTAWPRPATSCPPARSAPPARSRRSRR